MNDIISPGIALAFVGTLTALLTFFFAMKKIKIRKNGHDARADCKSKFIRHSVVIQKQAVKMGKVETSITNIERDVKELKDHRETDQAVLNDIKMDIGKILGMLNAQQKSRED